jgi:hypothetical protein
MTDFKSQLDISHTIEMSSNGEKMELCSSYSVHRHKYAHLYSARSEHHIKSKRTNFRHVIPHYLISSLQSNTNYYIVRLLEKQENIRQCCIK